MMLNEDSFLIESIYEFESHSNFCERNEFNENLFSTKKGNKILLFNGYKSNRKITEKPNSRRIYFSFREKPRNKSDEINNRLKIEDFYLRVRLKPKLEGIGEKKVEPKAFEPLIELFSSSGYELKDNYYSNFFNLMIDLEKENARQTISYLESKGFKILEITANEISDSYNLVAANIWDSVNDYIVPRLKDAFNRSQYRNSYSTIIQDYNSFFSIKLRLDSLSDISERDLFLEVIKKIDIKLYNECIFILAFAGHLTLKNEKSGITDQEFKVYVKNLPKLIKSNSAPIKEICSIFYFPIASIHPSDLNKTLSIFNCEDLNFFNSYLWGLNYYEYKEKSEEMVSETESHIRLLYDLLYKKLKNFGANFSPIK